ncbi:flagellar protein FlaG [Pseudomonas sp. NPDC096917]|uniref:flagellar protein FlaG n=1 Tax=Pseudomonas sp. NPDC096917 TaxID=3364483 RepID=UPI00383A28BD
MDMSIKLNAAYPAAVGPSSPAPAPVAIPRAEVDDIALPGKPPERVEVEKAVSDLREFAQSTQRQLDFSIDDTTGIMVVKVIATQSGEVIRQLPSEVALKLAQNLADPNSLLFNASA